MPHRGLVLFQISCLSQSKSQGGERPPVLLMLPETIKIKGGKGEPPFIIINKSDFDPETMKEFVESEKSKSSEPEGDDSTDDTSNNESSEDESDPSNTEPPTQSELSKKSKSELVVIAKGRGLKVVPDQMTNKTIIDMILNSFE